MTATEAMERASGNEAKASKSESDTTSKDHHTAAADDAHRTPKKRRKVNHGEHCRRFLCLPVAGPSQS
jgi:hypothetical protein